MIILRDITISEIELMSCAESTIYPSLNQRADVIKNTMNGRLRKTEMIGRIRPERTSISVFVQPSPSSLSVPMTGIKTLEQKPGELSEIIKYAEQYYENKTYNDLYEKVKDKDRFLRNIYFL